MEIVPLEGAGVQDLALELLDALQRGKMRARINSSRNNDLVEVFRTGAFDIDHPSILLVVALHDVDGSTEAQPVGQVEVRHITFEILLYMGGRAVTRRIVREWKIRKTALENVEHACLLSPWILYRTHPLFGDVNDRCCDLVNKWCSQEVILSLIYSLGRTDVLSSSV